MSAPIAVGGRIIGQDRPVFVIAELGYSFVDLDEALRAVDAVADSGADAVKLQTFRAETVVAKGFDFPPEAGGVDQFAEFKRYQISEETHRAIFERAKKRGIAAFSSPSHPDDLALLERLGVELHKIGSDDLTNIPLIRKVAGTGKPVILSTGMGTLEEVGAAVKAVRGTGNDKLVLLQCTSNYPIRDLSVVNLRVIPDYQKRFNVLVGLSDHTTTLSAAPAAVALGAIAIERHFALSKDNGTPDAPFSSDPAELAQLVRLVRETEKMLGDGAKKPTPTEAQMRQYTRKSAIACRNLPAGHTLSAGDFIIKRPALGVAPAEAEKLIGRVLKRPVREDQPIPWDAV
ncbi:MAG: N-acetylneuraminate synthase family protein [Elusimicrobia bacterium]|nr:N-acetylneuraminate synthase family protein [Elusimicrobiota bacterium]